ncbi:MAG: MBL fold metallo-hydrolase [Defluviitaleaceae bacterium]|nr:MBL fold metallo-hydrolase [Defluviitaleaceae bacterium]
MKKIELAQGIILYTFPPRREGAYFGDSITAIIDNNQAILIDVGFPDEAQQVLEDLTSKGIAIDKIIISHFHDDHMDGLKVLPKVPVYGSSRFQETLDLWTEKEDHQYFTPTIAVEQPIKIEHGIHMLEIIPQLGHSLCTVLVKINEQFLHVADEIMYATNNHPLLPSIEGRNRINVQLESWNKIKDYNTFTIIPGHGLPLDGNKLRKDIENRTIYAEAILATNNPISFEDATKNCDCTFMHRDWHDHFAE